MIPAAGIKDQELAVIAEGSGINHPAVTRRRDLGGGPGGDGNALFGAAQAVGSPEFPDPGAVDRQRQAATGRGEGDRRRKPAGIVEGGQIDSVVLGLGRRVPADRAARLALSRPCSTLPIKSLRLSTWRASSERLLPLGLQHLLGFGLLVSAAPGSAGRCAAAPPSARRRRAPAGPFRRRSPCGCAAGRRGRRPAPRPARAFQAAPRRA